MVDNRASMEGDEPGYPRRPDSQPLIQEDRMTGQNDMAKNSAREPTGAGDAPSSSAERAMDDVQVLWRKKKKTGPAGSADALSEEQTDAEQGSINWEERFTEEQAKAEDYY